MQFCPHWSREIGLTVALLAASAAGMRAQVAPTVRLTAPANEAALVAPALLAAAATASDVDGRITRVDFLLDGVPVGLDDRAPYTLNLKPVPAGNYVLTARAVDNSGLSSTSTPVNVTVRHVVGFGDDFFRPATLQIQPGETVLFRRLEGEHTVTGTGREAFCGFNEVPSSCVVTLEEEGSYPYECIFHDGMRGVVDVVSTPNTAPTVSLARPLSGARFRAGTTIGLSARASDAEGRVTSVQFMVGNKVVGTDRTAPYNFALRNLIPGRYTLSARAFDNRGKCRLSAPAQIRVVR